MTVMVSSRTFGSLKALRNLLIVALVALVWWTVRSEPYSDACVARGGDWQMVRCVEVAK